LNKNRHYIKIYFKNGKNLIIDRIKLYRALGDNLKLNIINCKIKKQFILKEKLLIWNDNNKKIEPFYKIRKYVKRSDRLIRIIRNLSIDLNKYLIIIFYDILLLNDIIYIRKFYNKRRRLFKFLIYYISNRINIKNREIIDFLFLDISELLRKIFTRAITRRYKKFILKNKKAIYQFNIKSRFCIIDTIDRYGISKKNILYFNRHNYFEQILFTKFISEFDIEFKHER
jgi:hypothetical protein